MTATDQRRSFSIVRTALLVLAIAFLLLGDILAFNQLATQSAVDAMTQSLVFSIGVAGAFEALRRLSVPKGSGPRMLALIPASLSFAAFVTWRSQLPIGWSLLITAAAACALGTIAVRTLWGTQRQSQDDTGQIKGLLCSAQTIVFVYLAALVVADAHSVLFV
ncbi:MAG: hypothetical protein WEA11_05645 [Acidimicrobiales bacterium]